MENGIAKTFTKTRKLYGLSQVDFARLIKCSRVALSMYENGKMQPSAERYAKVLRLLNAKQQKAGAENSAVTS